MGGPRVLQLPSHRDDYFFNSSSPGSKISNNLTTFLLDDFASVLNVFFAPSGRSILLKLIETQMYTTIRR